MRTIRFLSLMIAMLAVALWIGACSDDDPVDPGGGGGDTTAPQVVGSDPNDGEVSVSIGETVTIVFSEAMDPATSVGEITLSASAITGTDWVDDRTLTVDHGDWEEGVQITVTVGTGLKDVAGNALAAAHSFSFWTTAPGQLLLLDVTPADGAVDVNRDAGITLQFSESVNINTVEANVTITDNPILKVNYPFTAEQFQPGQVLLSPNSTLPEDTELTVIVGADVATWGGTTLGADQTFSFTTGVGVDTTPPTVISTDPVNGNMFVAATQGFFRMTFSEPVNPYTLEPSRQSLAFYFMMMALGSEPIWSEGGTVMTIQLPSLLPAGLPVVVEFVDFEDLAGNVQEERFVFEAKVAGTADYVPVVDGAQFFMEEEWAEGVVGNETPQNSGDRYFFQQMEVQLDDTFRMVDYEDPGFDPSGDWEAYRKTASALQWLGFFEIPDAFVKEMFDTPVDILPLPIAAGSWTDNTTLTIMMGDEPVPFRASLHGNVLPQADYNIAESEGEVFIKDAWTVVLEIEVEYDSGEGWVMAFTEEDTSWYAPTLGEVRITSDEVEDGMWYEDLTWRFPWSDTMMKGQRPTSIEEFFPQR